MWANACNGVEKMWVKDDPKPVGGMKDGICKPFEKGSILLILHAGSENGWVSDAVLVFQSKKATGNYHNKMMSEHLEEWFYD